MKKRFLYVLLFGIPGILWSVLFAAIILGAMAGFFWLCNKGAGYIFRNVPD